jgi:hypothetical protein
MTTRFHPILFQPKIARAIADGHKTETRRLPNKYVKSPGDILWVREPFNDDDIYNDDGGDVLYRAKTDSYPETVKWKPGIHMPKEYARLFLRVTGVFSELLSDITPEGVEAEGGEHIGCDTIDDFTRLFCRINGLSIGSDPIVTVIRFEVVARPTNWPAVEG